MAVRPSMVIWSRGGATFTDNRYSRGHRRPFDGGAEVPASSSPQIIPLPLSVAAAADPEEAFVASLASCPMLWFLSIAARQGFVVEGRRDEAVGVMSGDLSGNQAMTSFTLRPEVRFLATGDRHPMTW